MCDAGFYHTQFRTPRKSATHSVLGLATSINMHSRQSPIDMPIEPHDLDSPSLGLFSQVILACGKLTIKANHLAHNNRELQARWKTLKQAR